MISLPPRPQKWAYTVTDCKCGIKGCVNLYPPAYRPNMVTMITQNFLHKIAIPFIVTCGEMMAKEGRPLDMEPSPLDIASDELANTTTQTVENESNVESEEGSLPNLQEFSSRRIVLQRFTIYNSQGSMYIVGSNAKESLFRVLEIVKDPDNETSVDIIEDKNFFYTRKDMIELINGLNESVEGGIFKIARGYGLLGLIKFTKGYYLSLITKCSQVAVLGGHFIYHIDETKLIPLDLNYRRPDKYSDEEKLISNFKYLDLGKTFYFCNSYDITNTLQTNFLYQKRRAENYAADNYEQKMKQEHNERFVWNKLLLSPLLKQDIATYEWFQPIIHGFVDQANISVYGKLVYITIIARRSHHFAGARFLKRGVNNQGNVANEIETEQIVSDMLVTSFHDPKYGFYGNPRYTSFVQHRGSIPLFWTQDLNRLPKPPIEINLSDPFYQSSAIHFNNLFERYGPPVIILNLIKTKEKVPRELKLNEHFINCVKYLNQFLPEENRLVFNSFDMSKHSKKNLDVIGPLQAIGRQCIDKVGFFHNGSNLSVTKIQRGIIRTNCIDCLDRTNAAQFIICKEALHSQLAALNIISESTTLEYDSDLINILTEMFHDHGDTIAIQYGGSNLVNTMDSYRRINQWSSHTRDMLNSIKRIYSNSFMDLIRQEAINIFLGNYSYDPNKPKLWELQNDYYLHNHIQIKDIRTKVSYQHWFNSNFLRLPIIQSSEIIVLQSKNRNYNLEPYPDFNDNWFNECYVPRKYQSFNEIFQFNMNSNTRYFPTTVISNKKFDYSPFETRKPTVRPIKTGEFSESTGNANVKYLESEEYRKEEMNELHQSLQLQVNGDEETIALEDSKMNTSNYLTNPKKIRSFFSTKIEKLGYPGKTKGDRVDMVHNSDDQEGYYESDPSSTDASVFEIQVDQKTKNYYSSQLRLSFMSPNDSYSESLDFKISSTDTEIYKFYSSKLLLLSDSGSRDTWTIIHEQDRDIYSKYVDVDDVNLKTEDNYFY